MGCYVLAEENREKLVARARMSGDLKTGTEEFATEIGRMLQLIAATQEYVLN